MKDGRFNPLSQVEPVPVSPLRASIGNAEDERAAIVAWLEERAIPFRESAARLRGCNAKVSISYALALETAAKCLRDGEHHAQAIEAGTAETGTGSVHESAVHAPNNERPPHD